MVEINLNGPETKQVTKDEPAEVITSDVEAGAKGTVNITNKNDVKMTARVTIEKSLYVEPVVEEPAE